MNVANNYYFWEFWAPYDPANGYYGAHKCIFDGETKKIYIDPEINVVDVREDLYSDWKEWTAVRDNSKYPPAIRSTGGDPIGGGQFTGDIYFLINGWQVVADHEINMTGILFSDDYPSPYIITAGGGVIARVSSLAIAYNTGGSTGGASASEIWSYNTRTLTQTPTYNGPSAVEIRQEIDTASTRLATIDTKIDALPTPSEIADAVWDEDLSTHPTGAGSKIATIPTKEEIAEQTWQTPMTITLAPGTFGYYIAKKLLTVSKFIGLK